MDRRDRQTIRRFIKYINARRLTYIIESIADGLGYTEQQVCQKFNYDVFDYIYARECVQDNNDKYASLYDEMIAEQQHQDRCTNEV